MRLRAVRVVGSLCLALCAVPNVARAQDCPDGHFDGDIGGAAVRVFLSNGYPATERDQLLGTFIYTASWSGEEATLILDGTIATITGNCVVRFIEHDAHSRETGSWEVKAVDRSEEHTSELQSRVDI